MRINNIIRLERVKKSFIDGTTKRIVIDISNIEFPKRKRILISGSSGCGKTTLLNLISGLLLPDEGDIIIDTTNISRLNEVERNLFRANNIGYVFQDYKLFHGLSVWNNIMIGASFGNKIKKSELHNRCLEVIEKIGLLDKMHSKAGHLSGGEKQRVAIARSLIHTPKLILADEPTGNLDPDNSNNVMNLLIKSVKEQNTTLVVISHDTQFRSLFDLCINMNHINHGCNGGNNVDISVG